MIDDNFFWLLSALVQSLAALTGLFFIGYTFICSRLSEVEKETGFLSYISGKRHELIQDETKRLMLILIISLSYTATLLFVIPAFDLSHPFWVISSLFLSIFTFGYLALYMIRILNLGYIERGDRAFNNKKYGEAIECYTKALKYPKFIFYPAIVYSNRGYAHCKLNECDLAIEDCEAAINCDSTYAGAHNNCGVAYAGLGNPDKAIKYYNTAIEYDPNLTDAYLNRGIANKTKKWFEMAIGDFNKVIGLDPNDGEAWHEKGLCLKEMGQNKEAEKCLQKAEELGYKEC